jgi:hypothetical protein
MYYSISETMPTGVFSREQLLSGEDGREALLQRLLDSVLEGPSTQVRIPPNYLAKRELPPGNWAGVFLLYLASCKALKQRPASKATFYQAVKQWKGCLKFRKKSTHSTCHICDMWRAKMRHAASFWEHASATDALLGHLTLTWRCRQEYWAARCRSRARDDLLCMIVDGYDRSKPVLPRWGRGRMPKSPVFEKHNRPHLNISAVYCHGYCLNVFMSDEYFSTGGDYTWETLMISLDQCFKACREKNKALPTGLLGCSAFRCAWPLVE